jgi:hypothetical protein
VFFVTDSRLLDADQNSGADIYRFTESVDPASDPGNLSLITTGGDVPYHSTFGGAVTGVSDDGDRVYYQTISDHLAVWDHGTTTEISNQAPRNGDARLQTTVTASQPGAGRVSPDGNYFAFISNATLSADRIHGLTGAVTNNHYEMYVYSLSDHRLVCASCPSGAATVDVTLVPAATRATVNIYNVAARPRFLASDGRVFFSTAESLVGQDANGVMDAYEFDPSDGSLGLLSSGTGSNPASFADASASGDDVFVVTRQKLVGGDRDNLVDVYDARVGVAPPQPPAVTAPSCEGDSCAPSPSGGPAEDVLGSLTFEQGVPGVVRGKSFRVAHRFGVHGSVGALRVRFLAAGTLTWRAKGLHAGFVKHRRAGVYRVQVRLGEKARVKLVRRGRFVTALQLVFIGADGSEVTRTARLTFRAAAKKGR